MMAGAEVMVGELVAEGCNRRSRGYGWAELSMVRAMA